MNRLIIYALALMVLAGLFAVALYMAITLATAYYLIEASPFLTGGSFNVHFYAYVILSNLIWMLSLAIGVILVRRLATDLKGRRT